MRFLYDSMLRSEKASGSFPILHYDGCLVCSDKLPGAYSALATGIAVVIAEGLDMLGEPPAACHPVVWYGKLIRLLVIGDRGRRKAPALHPLTPPPTHGSSPFKYRFFRAPPSGAGREGRSGDTPETPPGAAPLDPAPKKLIPESGSSPRLAMVEVIWEREHTGSRRGRGRGLWGVGALRRPWLPQKPLTQFLYGTAMLILAAPIAILPTLAIHILAHRTHKTLAKHGHPCLGILSSALLQGLSLKPFFALQMLADAGSTVRQALEQDDLPAARHALRSLVSRDCSQLTPELLAAAAIESLAENLSDSVVAPLFYYLLFGIPGAAAYRLFNTFDSMIGYHGQYEYLGKAAARLDDILNFVPARLTALLIIALAPVFGGNRRAAWHIWRRDARKTESPNAGHPMAAMAGALGVQLEKVGHYILGDASGMGIGQAQGTVPTAHFSNPSRRDSALRLSAASVTTHLSITSPPLPCPRPQATHLRQAEQMVWRIGVGVIALTAVLTPLYQLAVSRTNHKRPLVGKIKPPTGRTLRRPW